MKIRFYFDEMMSHNVALPLRQRGYEVTMAVEAGMMAKDGMTQHLVYATEHEMVLVTQDKPFAGRTMGNTDHTGVICWTGKQDDIGGMVKKLAEFAENHDSEDVKGRVYD